MNKIEKLNSVLLIFGDAPLVHCIFAVCFLLSSTVFLYGQESGLSIEHTSPGNIEESTVPSDTSAAEATELISESDSGTADTVKQYFSEMPVAISAFKIIPQYYGLPLSVQCGWFYRKENFSIFPNLGFSFLLEGEPILNTSAGFMLRQGTFNWETAAVYNILPFTMHKKAADQVVYGHTAFTAVLQRVKITVPLRVGRQRRNEIISTKKIPSLTAKRTVIELSTGIRFDFFLTDAGFFKSTGTMAFHYHWVPKDRFHFYTLTADIPASFHLYYVDLAFMYSMFYTGSLEYGKNSPLRRYETAKPQSALTGRNTFKPAPKYTDIHLFSSEFRWYPVRLTAESNGSFISLFANAGIGITA